MSRQKRNKRINISEKNKKFFLLRESVKFDVKVIIVHYFKIVALYFQLLFLVDNFSL